MLFNKIYKNDVSLDTIILFAKTLKIIFLIKILPHQL